MVRISIPTLPHHHPVSSAATPKAAAIEQLCSFLARPGRAALLTGAGVSVDSGIRAYRGEDGRYMNPNYQLVFHPPFFLFLILNIRPILVGHIVSTLFISCCPTVSVIS